MSARDELIAGLLALADFYKNNPTMPADGFPRWLVSCSVIAADDAAASAMVEHAAGLLGTEVTRSGGHTKTKRMFGPIEVAVHAVTAERMAAHNALMSYADAVVPEGGAS
ncbi:hypothetical protein [Micromonospora sp. CB01531]|uniref:hypothetical protein n=1 Tax=Micromonospora sp. CB01531 TaxID=1718947 RepID=UPI00093DB787|nr:hypothetical protein [Micromonospora sp. CB01531]OKI47263.1 hypothetical protein A6A27_10470 [Micromonospora sp. CB01531]